MRQPARGVETLRLDVVTIGPTGSIVRGKMRYGGMEYAYAEPIARALVEDQPFRKWMLDQTEFSAFSDARLLHEEMKAKRSAVSENWWRSHFTYGDLPLRRL